MVVGLSCRSVVDLLSQRAMELAMKMADELGGKKQVDYVNTHGTSTPVGDVAELKAIKDR